VTVAPGSIVIRSAVATDALRVEAVHWASRAAAYKHVKGWPPAKPTWAERVEIWQAWLNDPDVTSLVAEVDDVVVGICTVRPSTDPEVDSAIVATMPTLYVHPDAWHRGYGRALCAEALKRAAARGFSVLTLWSIENNARAHEFYTAYGFTAESTTMAVPDWPHEALTARRYRIAL
jgi:ribosomal protein S18 acetylase RimI-like enzyme